ncbi:hypothetical protein D3C72_1752410 [compost metagenome]
MHDTGVVFQHVRTGDHVHAERFAQGLAGVARFQLGQRIVALAQQFHRAQQDARAFDRGQRGPRFLAGLGALHRRVEIVAVGAVDIGEQLAVGRVDDLEGLGAPGGDVAAADVQQLVGEGGHGDDSFAAGDQGLSGSDAGTAGGARTGR